MEYFRKRMLVSIIVPVYNVAPYLREALDSVVNQTYLDTEILVIDDGSTDGSSEICKEYALKDERIVLIEQDNKGLSAARNTGLDAMKGDVVSFLDPDDVYSLSFIDEMLEAMKREKVDIVICRYTSHYSKKLRSSFNKHKHVLPTIRAGLYNKKEALQGLAEGKINVNVWNKLYRRELWENMRFDEGHVCEDREIAYRICDNCERLYVIDNVLYMYRKRPDSITGSHNLSVIKDQHRASDKVITFLKRKEQDNFVLDILTRVQGRSLNIMMRNYVRIYKLKDIDKNAAGEDLRNNIIEKGKEIGLANCSFRTRVAYRLICHCPWMLRVAYPVYFVGRKWVYILIGK